MVFIRRLVFFSAVPTAVLLGQYPTGRAVAVSPKKPPSVISSSSVTHVKVTPDRATIRISVRTHRETAAAAARDNAEEQSSVLNALRKLGIDNKQISTADYNVEPQYRYVQNHEPILTGYVVTNTVIVDMQEIKMAGAVIDAALASGANMISSLTFYSSNTAAARRRAIAEGVENARGEAEAAAKAAGGELGKAIGIDIEGEPGPTKPMYARTMAMAGNTTPTPISPGDQTLTVRVLTRWQFIPNGRK